MAKTLKQKFLILGIAIGIILFVVGVGYYFAKQKSEPEFASKIDRIMFERKNKSPKYIITLPDKFFYSRKEEFLNAEDSKRETLPKRLKASSHYRKLKATKILKRLSTVLRCRRNQKMAKNHG